MSSRREEGRYEQLLARLRDPVQLRVFLTVVTVVVGYMAIYLPMDRRIREVSRKLAEERNRQTLLEDIEHLRGQVDKFQARLPDDTDTNQWIQYVLDGMRAFPLNLVKLVPDSPQRVGPYEAVVLQMQVEGDFKDLDRFLCWLESNKRLFRVDTANITPARGDERLVMQLTLLGMKG
jgi:Tfp pilus assembly protein PilO